MSSSIKSLRLAVLLTLIVGGALLLHPLPAFASWKHDLNTPSTTLPQGGSLNFDIILTYIPGGPASHTVSINVTAGTGVTSSIADPVVLSAANSPVTVPMVLRAASSAPLGNQIVTVRTSEGATTRTSTFTITVVSGGSSSPPVISAVSWTFTSSSITVTWNTSYAANSKVDYGTTTAYGQTVSTLSTYSTTHRITLPGLNPNTLYHFHITSCSSTNQCNVSDPDRQQRTSSASSDTTPPFITNILISASSNQATISWDTDENADSQVEWGTTVTYGSAGSPSFDPTLTLNHTLVMTGLSPTTTYYYVITSKDAAGNSANSGRGDVTHFFITVAPGQVDRIFTTGACTDPSTGNAIAIGQCSSGAPAQYCHSGGVLALDCTKCGYTCAAGQTCRADGTCADNPTPNAANPFQCNDASCYDSNGVFISPAAANCFSAFPACNANTILKVRPDRICTQWLTPKTSVTLVDPQSHLKEELSLSLTSCTALDSAGRCSTLVQGDHCQFDPLRICKTDADCSGVGLCVPPAHCDGNVKQKCTTDSECGTGQCVSDNLTYFTPRDRAKFAFLTGSVTPGLNWGGGHCSSTVSRACNQNSDCSGAETCTFDPAYGRCSTDPTSADYTKSCTTANATSACGAGKSCFITTVAGRYPWDLNRQVGIAVPQINNSEFEEIEKAEVNGRTVTQFPTRPWQAVRNASIRVVVDPTLIGSTTAGSNHVLEISPSADSDSGAFAPVGGFPVGPNQQYYLNIRLRSNGPQSVNVTFGAFPNDPGGTVNTFDLSDTWTTKLIALDTDGIPPQTYSLFVTCAAGSGGCSTNAFYVDDAFIQTALNVAFNPPDDSVVIPRSCRIYPQEDSLTCQYTLNGVLYSGQHGYCLQRDPDNDSLCLSWWPVDIIAGDGNFFGGGGGYSDRTPLYLCLESRGTVSAGAYLSPEVSRLDVRDVNYFDAHCDLFTGAKLGAGRRQDNGNNEACDFGVPIPTGTQSSCQLTCSDVGLLLGETSAGTGTNNDAYKDDLQDIQVTLDGSNGGDPGNYPGGTFILSRDNNWQFIACGGGVTNCPSTFDEVESAGNWTDTRFASAYGPGNGVGAKAVFSDSGLLTSILYRLADGTGSGGGERFIVKLHFREMCRGIAKVADGANTVPWASRVASRSYAIDTLLYKYTQDFAPYGGAVVPEDPNNPTTWTTGLNAEQPVTDDPSFSAPQYQSRSGSPYACVGNCSDRYCVGGKNNGSQCNSNPTICRTADTNGVQGICQGVGPVPGVATGSGASNRGFQIVAQNPTDDPETFAEQRARRLFAQSLGIFEWGAACVGGTNQGAFCISNSNCNSGICKAGYLSAGNVGWTPPAGLCASAADRNTFDASGNSDYCAIAPTASNLKVNGGSTASIRNGASITLTFNFNADSEQVPVQHIFVDWGDGTTDPLDKSLTPQVDPANPISFTHPYTCSQTAPCTFRIRVLVVDNWGWGSNPGASSRGTSSDRTTVNHTNWVQGPTVTVTP